MYHLSGVKREGSRGHATRAFCILAILKLCRGLDQPFSLHSFLDARPRAHSSLKGLQVRPLRDVDILEAAPVRNDEQIDVGDGKLTTDEKLLARKMLVHMREGGRQILFRDWLVFLGRAILEQRCELLVNLRRNEIQPFQRSVIVRRAVLGQEPRLGLLIG